MSESKIIIETITSAVLQDNPLGDSPVRRVPVYLPPDYEDSQVSYPVVYLLAGFTNRGIFMLNDSGFDEPIDQRMDRLIATGVVQPMILVLPDCFTRYGGSQYLNSNAIGRYEDHLIEELVPFIDGRYRTRAESGYRAIAGKSSGGYGALVQAMHHPKLFGAVACHSGDMYFEYCYKADFVKFLNAAGRLNLTTPESLGQFLIRFYPKMQPKPDHFFALLNIVAMSACYSPNQALPCGFDLPFDPITGEVRFDVWQRWLEHDPITMLKNEQHVEALRQLKLLYLDCGNRDEYGLHYGARIFSHRLQQLGVPYIYEEFNGTHLGTQHRYDVSLKAISEAMGNF